MTRASTLDAPIRSPMTDTRPFDLDLSAKTRVALVGAGYIADFHLQVLRGLTDVEVVAVCDVALDKATALARRFGVPHAVDAIAKLPDLGVHIAHVTTPPDLHVLLCEQLLDLGIGVFCEKPLALDAASAAALTERAARRRLPLAVNHNNVYHPAFTRLVSRLAAGEIGRLEHVQVTLSVPLRQLDAGDYSHWMFRAPRNIVFEQATHPLSQIHHLLGPLKRVQTTVLHSRELHPGQMFHDRFVVAAEAERGTAEIYMAFGPPFTRSTLAVLGSDGSLEADLFHGQVVGEEKTYYLDFWNSFLAGWRRGGAYRRDARNTLLGWAGSTLGLCGRRDVFYLGMRDSIAAFHHALRRHQPLPGDGRAATEVIAWCDAVGRELPATAPAAPKFPPPRATRPGEIVVLGATGFIGRRVVERLLERGAPVTAVVRRTHSLPAAISTPALDGRLRLVRGSLEDPAGLVDVLRGASACIQLATGGGDTWEKVERAMVAGSLRVAEACRDAGVKRMVYVSTIAALYLGADCGRSLLDDAAPTDPQPELRPLYARGKIAAESALLAFQRQHDIGLIIARPGVVLGAGTPMQHSGLGLWVRDNHCVGWGLGDHPLPLVLADDVADALVSAALLQGDALHGQALNLCARVPLTAQEVVAELRRVTGRSLRFHPRPLWRSQAMEIGKWLVKLAGRRKDAQFPSYRDLKSRALVPAFACNLARERLGWRPIEEREAFLDRAVRIYAP